MKTRLREDADEIPQDHRAGRGRAGACRAAAHAQAPEKKDVKLGVGGATSLYYLPLALTEKLGYFKEQGLNVEINDFKGGSQSLQRAGRRLGRRRHRRLRAHPAHAGQGPGHRGGHRARPLSRHHAGVKKDRMDKIKSIADLKGAKIGVTAPGSSTNMIV